MKCLGPFSVPTEFIGFLVPFPAKSDLKVSYGQSELGAIPVAPTKARIAMKNAKNIK